MLEITWSLLFLIITILFTLFLFYYLLILIKHVKVEIKIFLYWFNSNDKKSSFKKYRKDYLTIFGRN